MNADLDNFDISRTTNIRYSNDFSTHRNLLCRIDASNLKTCLI
ncbi:hypothetical protein LG368_12825 [Marinomonas sp. E8]|uniref:Uncharacterized protein n=1 Tax=Marinomonas algarum TaxID=2883105 RepID=A0A9X1LFB0_9GAMM|nr:hypothetical protein [Marinomonas algarum]